MEHLESPDSRRFPWWIHKMRGWRKLSQSHSQTPTSSCRPVIWRVPPVVEGGGMRGGGGERRGGGGGARVGVRPPDPFPLPAPAAFGVRWMLTADGGEC